MDETTTVTTTLAEVINKGLGWDQVSANSACYAVAEVVVTWLEDQLTPSDRVREIAAIDFEQHAGAAGDLDDDWITQVEQVLVAVRKHLGIS